jgi:hypothetical protein
MSEQIATKFILQAIQDWGQSEAAGIAATQAVLDAAGFNAKATCRPVFGAIWPKPCVGKDGSSATEWLKQLTETMPRGKFENESSHVEKAIAERRPN